MDRQIILQYIPQGRENAIPAQRLAELTGAVSERQLRADIAEIRKAGGIICSCSGGYFRPATRGEILEFIERMERHAKSCFRAVQSAREALKQIEGQQSMDSIWPC